MGRLLQLTRIPHPAAAPKPIPHQPSIPLHAKQRKISSRNSSRSFNFTEILLPALAAVTLGILILPISRHTWADLPGIKVADAVATSHSVMAAGGITQQIQSKSYADHSIFTYKSSPPLRRRKPFANTSLSHHYHSFESFLF